MTSFAVNYNRTPELIAKDKELKEKYGASAHVIPAKIYVVPENNNKKLENSPQTDTVETQKFSKETAAALIKGGAALTGAYALKKSLPKIFEKAEDYIEKNGNGKIFKIIVDWVNKLDEKFVLEDNKASRFINKYFKLKKLTRSDFQRKASNFCAVGLAVAGGYQLIKAAVSAFSDKN